MHCSAVAEEWVRVAVARIVPSKVIGPRGMGADVVEIGAHRPPGCIRLRVRLRCPFGKMLVRVTVTGFGNKARVCD